VTKFLRDMIEDGTVNDRKDIGRYESMHQIVKEVQKVNKLRQGLVIEKDQHGSKL
jgi:hypothetical protein